MGGLNYNAKGRRAALAEVVDGVLSRAAGRRQAEAERAERDACTCPPGPDHDDSAHVPGLGCTQGWAEGVEGCQCPAALSAWPS